MRRGDRAMLLAVVVNLVGGIVIGSPLNVLLALYLVGYQVYVWRTSHW